MTDRTDDMTVLEPYFDAARQQVPALDDALMARIMADAEAVSATHEAAVATPGPGWISRILQGIGGWPAVSGMVTATVLGLAVGINPPSMLEGLASGYLVGTSDPYLVDPYQGFGFDLSEG